MSFQTNKPIHMLGPRFLQSGFNLRSRGMAPKLSFNLKNKIIQTILWITHGWYRWIFFLGWVIANHIRMKLRTAGQPHTLLCLSLVDRQLATSSEQVAGSPLEGHIGCFIRDNIANHNELQLQIMVRSMIWTPWTTCSIFKVNKVQEHKGRFSKRVAFWWTLKGSWYIYIYHILQ